MAPESVELLADAGGTQLLEVVEDQRQRTLESTDRVGERRHEPRLRERGARGAATQSLLPGRDHRIDHAPRTGRAPSRRGPPPASRRPGSSRSASHDESSVVLPAPAGPVTSVSGRSRRRAARPGGRAAPFRGGPRRRPRARPGDRRQPLGRRVFMCMPPRSTGSRSRLLEPTLRVSARLHAAVRKSGMRRAEPGLAGARTRHPPRARPLAVPAVSLPETRSRVKRRPGRPVAFAPWRIGCGHPPARAQPGMPTSLTAAWSARILEASVPRREREPVDRHDMRRLETHTTERLTPISVSSTRVSPPRAAAGTIPRGRLFERLDAGVRR